MPDIVLTGVPRSGSTLVCNLLNRCADTVALHEPLRAGQFAADTDAAALPELIAQFFGRARESLITRRVAPSKARAGVVPDNNCAPSDDRTGLRRSTVEHGEVAFEGKDLSADFYLAVKHNTLFTVALADLVPRFRCFGIVRHPLAVLASWNSVDMPVQQGFVPIGQRFEPALDGALRRITDRVERQFYVLEWFFERFLNTLPRASILRYEELIASGGKSLSAVVPDAVNLAEPLTERNQSALYDREIFVALGEKLLGRSGAFWEFYSRESVAEMLVNARASSMSQ